jgi:hypothetical protein
MTLSSRSTRFETEVRAWEQIFVDFLRVRPAFPSNAFSRDDECFLEGLLSRVWQEWSAFCRSCVIDSCMGTVAGDGRLIAALPNAVSEAHVSAAAIRVVKRRKLSWRGINTVLRFEPTWGDVAVIVSVVQSLAPSNGTQLLAAFSAGHEAAKTLQLLRNAAAHHHVQNMAEVQLLAQRYLAFPITHPTHALLWVERTSRKLLLQHVMDELSLTASTATY